MKPVIDNVIQEVLAACCIELPVFWGFFSFSVFNLAVNVPHQYPTFLYICWTFLFIPEVKMRYHHSHVPVVHTLSLMMCCSSLVSYTEQETMIYKFANQFLDDCLKPCFVALLTKGKKLTLLQVKWVCAGSLANHPCGLPTPQRKHGQYVKIVPGTISWKPNLLGASLVLYCYI